MPDAGLEIDLVDCPDDALTEDEEDWAVPYDVLLEAVGLAVVARVPVALVDVVAEDAAVPADLADVDLAEVTLDEDAVPEVSALADADLAVATLVLADTLDAEPLVDACPLDDVLVDAPPAYILGRRELLLGLPSYLLP